jgi:hypothetical protein
MIGAQVAFLDLIVATPSILVNKVLCYWVEIGDNNERHG